MSSMIVYFSPSSAHMTKKAAQKISALTGFAEHEIEPAVEYTQADMDWMDSNSRSTLESKPPYKSVDLKSPLPDLAGVDTLYIGFPVWWYDAPRLIYSYLETLGSDAPVLVPFCTSGGTDMQTCENKMTAACPQFTWKKGLRITPLTTDEQILEWIGKEDK